MDSWELISMKFEPKYINFHSGKWLENADIMTILSLLQCVKQYHLSCDRKGFADDTGSTVKPTKHAHFLRFVLFSLLHQLLYSRLPLKRGPLYHDITNGTAMPAPERKSDLKLTKDTPYIALTGELWGVCYDNFEENWPHHNGTTL